MKKLIVILFLILPGQLFAEDPRMYFSGKLGVNLMNDIDIIGDGERVKYDFDTGFSGSLAIGFERDSMRFELEYGYRDADFDSASDNTNLEELQQAGAVMNSRGGLEVHSLLANAYYDFYKSSIISPYVGAGLGFAWQTQDGALAIEHSSLPEGEITFSTDKTSLELGSQILAGVNLDISESIDLDLGYRLFMTSRDLQTHSFELGMRYLF